MDYKLSGLVLLILGLLDLAKSQAVNCNPPYSHALGPQCDAADRNHSAFLDLSSQLQDASNQEHILDFVLNTTLGMYKFLHPCASTAEAALMLFLGVSAPEQTSIWWNDMAVVLGESLFLVGRRKRAHYTQEDELLRVQLEMLLQATGNDGGCVQYLIEAFKDQSAQVFKAKYPNFVVPATTTLTPTTTQNPTTITTTPTTIAAVTYNPIRCTDCNGLRCLIAPTVSDCPGNQFFCLTTVEEAASGRLISRSCATQSQCDTFFTSDDQALCSLADNQILPRGTFCHFCCLGNNCNNPPQVTPNRETLYQHH